MSYDSWKSGFSSIPNDGDSRCDDCGKREWSIVIEAFGATAHLCEECAEEYDDEEEGQ